MELPDVATGRGVAFTIEMMAATGESWVWTDLDVDEAMDVYEMLGEPETFRRMGETR